MSWIQIMTEHTKSMWAGWESDVTDQSHVAEEHKKIDHMTGNFIGEQTTQDV